MIRKEFLVGELKYRYPELLVRVARPREGVGRPLFYEPSERRVSARAYVARGADLPGSGLANESAALFLAIGEPNSDASDALDLCVFPPDADGLSLLNFVQRLFDRLDEWNQRLKRIAESGEDCASLLEEAAGMLQNPVWLCDERGHVVARAERYYTEKNDTPISSYKLMEHSEGTAAGGVTFHADDGENALLCAVIPAGGARFTLVLAARERPFYGSDESVFENLTGYVRQMLSERRISARALRPNRDNDEAERVFRALLDGEPADGTAFDALERVGWAKGERFCVLAAETRTGDFRESVVNALCDKMEETFLGCCAFGRAPVIATIFREEASEEELKRRLREFAGEKGLWIGLSATLEGFSFLPERLDQAIFSLDEAKARNEAFVPFAAAADAYLAKAATRELPYSLICARPILEMAAYDREHGTNYLDTAERYVKNRYNAVKTASELFIHRSTFLYRLERMQAQFGLDLDAEQVSPLQLLLSFHLLGAGMGERKEAAEE